jgi:hypothetical protein
MLLLILTTKNKMENKIQKNNKNLALLNYETLKMNFLRF